MVLAGFPFSSSLLCTVAKLLLLLLSLGPLAVHLIVKTFFLPAHFLQPMLSPLLLPLLGNQGEIVSLRSTVTAQVIQLSTNTKASNNLSNALFLHHTAPHIVIITVGDLVPSQVGDISPSNPSRTFRFECSKLV